MGYYTYYDLTVEPANMLTESKIQEIDAVITKIPFVEFEMFDSGNSPTWRAYVKWYEYREDMCRISELFPELTFVLHRDGEISDDFWIEYYLDGKFQHCGAALVYEEFDKNKLTPLPKG